MRQFHVRMQPPFPHLDIQQRASTPEAAVKAALHFHGAEWRKVVRKGWASVSIGEVPCPVTYDRLIFTPGMRHGGKRIYRANPFDMIRAGEKTTTVRRPRYVGGTIGDIGVPPEPAEEVSAHEAGELLECCEGGMRSGLVIEIVTVDCIEPHQVTPDVALHDGFHGTDEGAVLMASYIEAEGGCLDWYTFRYRADLSFLPEAQP